MGKNKSRKTPLYLFGALALIGVILVAAQSGTGGAASFVANDSTLFLERFYHVTGWTGANTMHNQGNQIVAEYAGSGSPMVGKDFNQMIVTLYKPQGASLTGVVEAGVFNSAGTLVYDMGSLSATAIATDPQYFTFYNGANRYTIQEGDRIGVRYTHGDATNHVLVHTNIVNPYGGTTTFLQTFSGGQWTSSSNHDLTASFSLSFDDDAPAQTGDTATMNILSEQHTTDKAISGLQVTIVDNSVSPPATYTGATPMAFNAIVGHTYDVTVQDASGYQFVTWGSGQTEQTRSISPNILTFIIAKFKVTDPSAIDPPVDPEAPEAGMIKVSAVTTAGEHLNMYTTLQQGGQIVHEGFTPVSHNVGSGQQFTLTVADFENYTFDRWSDGVQSASRPANEGESFLAIYVDQNTVDPEPTPAPDPEPDPEPNPQCDPPMVELNGQCVEPTPTDDDVLDTPWNGEWLADLFGFNTGSVGMVAIVISGIGAAGYVFGGFTRRKK